MRKPTPRRVAIIYPASVPWFASCVDGIRNYAREHGEWSLFLSPPTLRGAAESELTLRTMQDWQGDAIIAASNDMDELKAASAWGIPIINLAAGIPKFQGIPRVMVDHFQAGGIAADHLLKQGLRHLAYFGWKDIWYSDQRRLGFMERAAQEGIYCESFLRAAGDEAHSTWHQRITEPAKWLASLPRPCGIFAVHDYRALLLVEACREAKLKIPDDIAVIGMDNDVTVCEHSVPTLTSVKRGSERVGREAAALVDRIMHGATLPDEDVLIMPDGVVSRQSTEMLHCPDPLVKSALNYMRGRMSAQFNISEIAEYTGVSKRTLETRFRNHIGCSPHDFLTRLRIQHAEFLMEKPENLTMLRISSECGFGAVSTFYAAFQRIHGEPPATFRERKRGPATRQSAPDRED